jgi:hypothetical protein
MASAILTGPTEEQDLTGDRVLPGFRVVLGELFR